MSAPKEDKNLNFKEVGKRPTVTTYLEKPEFHTGDKVYWLNPEGNREGPYWIASVTSAGKFTLSLENGKAVNDGGEVKIDALEAA
ncbi:hypothetical protein G7Y89_g1036 [Cudoniella acicularis]|uniref:Uncharacterized protein n=1 Tax=Cudoniella acicularis TaxID=354080 RepID=A0A8H4RX27_9HELO|nr:hypothetical protein G7Y89_g1036 [Cudoniella acicularis]